MFRNNGINGIFKDRQICRSFSFIKLLSFSISLSMSVALLKKSMLVYKPIVLWNILISLIIGLFFVIDGYTKPGPYVMIIIMKPVGWIFSIVIERFFLTRHSYFYKNQGLGFRRILINIIIYDIALLFSIIITCLLCRNFLLTVLPTAIINKQY